MAQQQGPASAWVRKGKILLAADSIVHGGWRDERGVMRGATATDFEAYSELLPEDSALYELGRHLRNALLASRIDRPEDWYSSAAARSTNKLAIAFGLKSASSVYQGMRMVSVDWVLGEISMLPSIRRFRAHFDFFRKKMATTERSAFRSTLTLDQWARG